MVSALAILPAVQRPVYLDLSQVALVAVLAVVGMLTLLVIGLAVLTAALRVKNNRKARRWNRLEEAWTGPLLEVLAGEQPVPALWERVAHRDRLYFVEFLFRYARRLRGLDRDALTELARPFLPEIARRLQNADAERRARALDTLASLGFVDYEADILAALGDASPLVSMIAARNLCRHGRVQHIEAVLATMERFEHWSPKYLASILAAAGPGAATALRRVLADPARTAALRVIAAGALQALHDPDAGDVAAPLLESETDREVVSAILRLLAEVGHDVHLPRIRALCSSADEVVRAQALAALSRLGTRADAAFFLKAFRDVSPWVAIHAARGLREVGGAPLLRVLARNDPARAALATQVLAEEAA